MENFVGLSSMIWQNQSYIHKILRYRVFIKYCGFSLKLCDFSELCQFCCSAGVLPAWCVYTHWHQGKQRKTRVRNILKSFEKTIFNVLSDSLIKLSFSKIELNSEILQAKSKRKLTRLTWMIIQDRICQEQVTYDSIRK